MVKKLKYDLSIIIPIYNGQNYIEQCLKSIKTNKLKYEIIIVNDGSKDKTKEILKKIKNKNIKIINLNKNYGVSHTRNKGLDNVNGTYFTFIDIDDYINPHTYDKIYEIATKDNLDICGFNFFEVDKKQVKSKYKYDNNLLNKDEIIKHTLKDEISLLIWDKIYKTEKYKDIRFNEQLKINEDNLFVLNCITKTNKARFINEYLYNYQNNNNSLTNKYTCKQIKQNNYLKYIDDDIKQKLKKYKEYKIFKNNNLIKTIHLYSQCKDKKNRSKYLKENVDKNKLKKILRTKINILTKIEIIIYLISIKLHLKLYPTYEKIKQIIRR